MSEQTHAHSVGEAVRVCAPRDYGAGTQHWVGRIGVVKRRHGRRACDVQLDGDKDHLWFFDNELEAC